MPDPELPDKQGDAAGEPPPPFDSESRQEHTGVDQDRMRDLGYRERDARERGPGERGPGEPEAGERKAGEDFAPGGE